MGHWRFLLSEEGVVRTGEYPQWRNVWSREVRAGRLIRPLPGVIMDVRLEGNVDAWMRAVQLWDPNAVVAGRAAARASFTPGVEVQEVPVYVKTRMRDRGPLRFRGATIPLDLTGWANGLRVSTPVGTALTAGLEGDFQPGTDALRLRLATPRDIVDAVDHWSGKVPSRLRKVATSLSGNPWSVAEVEFHSLLRAGGIRGWVANPALCLEGQRVSPDVAFLASRTAFEVNSFAHHSARSDMERDSARLNLLTAAGWRVYTVTPRQVREASEETVEFIRSVVWARHRRSRARSQGRGRGRPQIHEE